MKVTVNIPDREWFDLATEAERRGVKVGDMLAARLRGTPSSTYRPIVLRDRVTLLVEKGIPDPVIAERLGESLEVVRSVRRKAGLKPNRFRRERWEHEFRRAESRPSSLEAG